MHDHRTESRGHLYSALLGATLLARASRQGLICFNLHRAEQTLTIGTLYHIYCFNACVQIEGFAFSHIIFT